ncbi:UDP-N-acetylglucosamine transferase subunit ALG14 -like protein [Caligus rogercresseyi]|uniref:UDP-N-acetylglucosamine transferase subunit ALG14 -like protein n=1 Tax=Caligus rogercresseyi TaxID=217165 RepID=A0A7T8KJI4_CALRO|nr:UDP-N-acetylglucosamine transferase subunit ALG14 -like protein [Caligus rogercresseyi]
MLSPGTFERVLALDKSRPVSESVSILQTLSTTLFWFSVRESRFFIKSIPRGIGKAGPRTIDQKELGPYSEEESKGGLEATRVLKTDEAYDWATLRERGIRNITLQGIRERKREEESRAERSLNISEVCPPEPRTTRVSIEEDCGNGQTYFWEFHSSRNSRKTTKRNPIAMLTKHLTS